VSEKNVVVAFPKGRSRPVTKDGDEKLAADIHSAWRRLHRCVQRARAAGLTVEADYHYPVIMRKL
jgi:hypothetical protein